MKKIYHYTIDFLQNLDIKHDIHTFKSGVIMVDVWHNEMFYVLQFENDFVGFSDIKENPGFDTVPDEKFYNLDDFVQKLDRTFANT